MPLNFNRYTIDIRVYLGIWAKFDDHHLCMNVHRMYYWAMGGDNYVRVRIFSELLKSYVRFF